jgi:hypothetical protein
MISAKDEFFLEREQINELANLINGSDMTHEQIDNLGFDLTEDEFSQLKKTLLDRQISPLEAVKRGCILSAYQVNKAVKQAANDPQ